jgi:hypothetical protein
MRPLVSHHILALLVYTHVLSIGREVELVWKNVKRPASWMYLCLRYPALVTVLMGISLNSYTPKVNTRISTMIHPPTDSQSCCFVVRSKYCLFAEPSGY